LIKLALFTISKTTLLKLVMVWMWSMAGIVI